MPVPPIFFVVGIAATAAVAVGVKAIRKLARPGVAGKQRGTLVTTRATDAPRRIIYGRSRVAPIERWIATSGADNEVLDYIFVWCEGPVESVETIYFDDQVVPLDGSGNATGFYAGHVTIKHKLGGTDNATGFSGVEGWSSDNLLTGICYSHVQLTYDEAIFPNGVPNITAVIKGRNDIKDPRDSDAEDYRNNVALVLAHYLTLDRLGPGVDYATGLDMDALQDAADVCDEDVDISDSTTAKRYTYNGVIELDREPEDIIAELRAHMAGLAIWRQGTWVIRAGAYVSPTFAVTEAMAVGKLTFGGLAPRRESVNTVKGLYAGEATRWYPVDYPAWVNSAAVTADGGELLETIDFLGADTIPRARRLAAIFERRARLTRTLEGEFNIEALRAVAGEAVSVTISKYGLSAVPMEVVQWSMSVVDGDVRVRMALREIASSVYAWSAGDIADDGADLEPDPSPPGVYQPGSLQPPTFNISYGNDVLDGTTLTWDAPSVTGETYEYQATTDGSDYNPSGSWTAGASYDLDGDGVFHRVFARTVVGSSRSAVAEWQGTSYYILP